MLNLSERELERIAQRIEEDVRGALTAHRKRMDRFVQYYRRWRGLVDPPAPGEEDRPNLHVPMLQWHVFAKWSKSLQALFGDDAEVIAQPSAQADQRIVHKVGRFMTVAALRLIEDAISKYAIYVFRAIVFGVSIAYRPWERITHDTPGGPEVLYDGPGFYPCWPDDVIVPAEDVSSVQEFSFVLRKYRATPDDLLRGEEQGRYFGIEENFEEIVRAATNAEQRAPEGDELKREKDTAEGVTAEGAWEQRGCLTVWEWYGRWRMPKSGDPEEGDLKKRELRETDIVVRYLPTLHKVIGCDRLMDLYPRMRNRRPFAQCSIVKDGSFWSPGYGELLEGIESEATAIHNLFTEGAQFAAGPMGFYDPTSGLEPEKIRYKPFMLYPVQNSQGIAWQKPNWDPNGPVLLSQKIDALAERVTGQSDQTLGRSIDRPNAPRTAAGQALLAEQGDMRGYIDVLFFREDFQKYLRDLWEMYVDLAPPSVFFRITEEDAGGLFPVRGGAAEMTGEEFAGRFDFIIRFATSAISKEANKERQLSLYQIDLQNPLIVQNPRALWSITKRLHSAFGDDNFADLVPEPPDLDMPKNPRQEWTLALQGEDIHVHPLDNDDIHLIDHYRRVTDPTLDEQGDQDAVQRMTRHILDHQQQKRVKALKQTLVQGLVGDLDANSRNPAMGGLHMGGGTPLSLLQLQQHLAGLTGGQPSQPGQPGAQQQPPEPGTGGDA